MPTIDIDTKPAARFKRLPDRQRFDFALHRNRIEIRIDDNVASRQVGALIDNNSPWWGNRLQPRGRVDYVTDNPLAVAVLSRDLHDGLAGCDRNTDRQRKLGIGGIQIIDGPLHSQSGANCSLRVILMSNGSPKDCKYPVSHEFFNPTTESLDVLTDLPVVHRQAGTNIFRIRLCGVCSEADKIHKED